MRERMNTLFSRRVLIVAIVFSCVRVGAFAFLLYLEATGRQSIAMLPLILLLYPEGLLMGSDLSWTAGRAIGFAALLIAGSFSLTLIGAFVVRLVNSWRVVA